MPLKLKKRPDSPYWQIHGSIGKRRIRESAETTDRKAAEEIRAALEARLRREALYGRENETTFGEAALAYIEDKNVDNENVCSRMLSKIILAIGETKLADLTPGGIRDLAKKLLPTGAPAYRNRHAIAPVMAVYNHAVKRKLAPPLVVERFKEKKPNTTSVDRAYIDQLRAHLDDPYVRAIVKLDFEAGMRIGTAVQLTREMVDTANCKIVCPGEILKQKDPHAYPISAAMARELDELPPIADFNKSQAKRPGQRRDPSLLFGFRNISGVYKHLKRGAKAAGLRYLPTHQIGRHSMATTYLVDEEIDPVTVAAIGGWKDVSHLMKRYPHSRDAKLRAVVERVSGGEDIPALRVVKGRK